MTTRAAGACDCGFTGTYRSEAQARYALSRHRCDTWLTRQAKKQAAAAARLASGPTRDCRHTNTHHQHGTYAAYVLDRCHCRPCRDANSDYEALRAKQIAYGTWEPYVPAWRSRAHCRRLMDAGMGLKQVAKTSGIAHGLLSKLMYGVYNSDGTFKRAPSKRVRATTEARILAVQLDLADGAKVDGLGTRRRLQALVAIGYAISDLGRRIDLTNIHRTIHNDGPVLQATAASTRALYDQLSMTPNQPSDWRAKIAANRARSYAIQHRWAPPLAWDDDSIELSDTSPDRGSDGRLAARFDQVVIDRILAGERLHATKAERIAVTAAWQASGRSLNQLEQLTGWKADRYTSSSPEQLDGAA
jgi:hypothetical protein